MKILPIKTNSKHYNIYIGNNIISKVNQIIKKEGIYFKNSLIIVDKKIPKLFIKKLKSKLICEKKLVYLFNASEKNKNFFYLNNILEILLKNNFTRNDAIVCMGGGIAGDISAFAASIYKRGIKFINMPSTLLSQVDSSIGGKTGINNKYGKNLIGSFYQPDLVISDINLLKSLPKRELICGYAEILKHSLIKDKKLFSYLNKNLKNILNLSSPFIEKAIYESCKIKKKVVEKDEKEIGLRKILNFGHTFAHAYEAGLGYNHKLNHGEAVILGMKTALSFSFKENMLSRREYNLIINHIYNSGLPFSVKNYFSIKDLNKILSFMIKDKKNNSGNINLVLLRKIGKPIFNKQYSKKKVSSFLEKFLID